ncbi:MAG TPA: YceI family protein [Gemmatimonadaceae bacterium]
MTTKIKALFLISTVALTACEPSESAEARSIATAQPSAEPSTTASATNPEVAYRFVTATSGNSARYRIREQLVGLDLPNDAVGETKGVTGVIAADKSGNIIPAESKFTVDVSNLVSDKDRRDGFVKRRVLQTDQFPTVTLVPTSIKGLSLPLPSSGAKTFDLIGDLTVRGVTRPTTWKVDAQFAPTGMNGKAITAFTFQDFGIDQPRVPVVLSVADTIKLELDFSMVKEMPKR